MTLHTSRTFDWAPRHDPASKNFGISEVVTPITPRAKYWLPGTVLDQGREGACVGFGFSGETSASPVRQKGVSDTSALGVYHDAQAIDRAQGNNWTDGASVLSGAKVITARGMYSGYRWAFNVEQIRDALISEGPVVIGIPWFDSMYYTRPSGLVEVSGNVVGGHCILVNGYTPKRTLKGENSASELFRWRNSWGPDYGVAGHGFVKIADLDRLLQDQGEAVVPMGRKAV